MTVELPRFLTGVLLGAAVLLAMNAVGRLIVAIVDAVQEGGQERSTKEDVTSRIQRSSRTIRGYLAIDSNGLRPAPRLESARKKTDPTSNAARGRCTERWFGPPSVSRGQRTDVIPSGQSEAAVPNLSEAIMSP